MTELERPACFVVTRSWDDSERPDRLPPDEDET